MINRLLLDTLQPLLETTRLNNRHGYRAGDNRDRDFFQERVVGGLTAGGLKG